MLLGEELIDAKKFKRWLPPSKEVGSNIFKIVKSLDSLETDENKKKNRNAQKQKKIKMDAYINVTEI